jgi:hypothetical protein
MRTHDQKQDTSATPAADRESEPVIQTAPRGNQDPEQEWVDRGEEQLEKVSGN